MPVFQDLKSFRSVNLPKIFTFFRLPSPDFGFILTFFNIDGPTQRYRVKKSWSAQIAIKSFKLDAKNNNNKNTCAICNHRQLIQYSTTCKRVQHNQFSLKRLNPMFPFFGCIYILCAHSVDRKVQYIFSARRVRERAHKKNRNGWQIITFGRFTNHKNASRYVFHHISLWIIATFSGTCSLEP